MQMHHSVAFNKLRSQQFSLPQKDIPNFSYEFTKLGFKLRIINWPKIRDGSLTEPNIPMGRH